MRSDPTASRRWWAPIGLGALICAGCCLAPVLIAAGIFGGGVTLLGLSSPEPLGFALLADGAAGLIWSRTRARRTGCTSTDSATTCTGSGCGCSATAAA